jgi:hypothetical protein
MPEACGDQHQGRFAIGEGADYARSPSNPPYQPFQRVVGAAGIATSAGHSQEPSSASRATVAEATMVLHRPVEPARLGCNFAHPSSGALYQHIIVFSISEA